MPLEEEMRLRLNESNIGYLPVNASIQQHSSVYKATRPNYNESFFISYDRRADHPDVRGKEAMEPQPTENNTIRV